MMQPDYNSFTANDFLEDKQFLQWVKYKSPEESLYFNNWVGTNPANLNAFRSAEQQLEMILLADRVIPGATDAADVWERISNSIAEDETRVIPLNRNKRLWLVAATIAAISLVTAAVFVSNYNPTKKIMADYGQLKTFSLPDASVVKLNANSTVEYLSRWQSGRPREVYLKGEAYFTVEHYNKDARAIAAEEKFIVYTEKIRVDVLGTTFNIKERRGKTEVSLVKGSLLVQVLADTLQKLLLQPGELAAYNHQTKRLQKIVADPAFYKDWTEKKILTNNTTVAEIIRELEDVYGYKIVLEDAAMASRRIDGTIPMKSEENVLFVLSNMLDIDIVKQKDRLVFKNRK